MPHPIDCEFRRDGDVWCCPAADENHSFQKRVHARYVVQHRSVPASTNCPCRFQPGSWRRWNRPPHARPPKVCKSPNALGGAHGSCGACPIPSRSLVGRSSVAMLASLLSAGPPSTTCPRCNSLLGTQSRCLGVWGALERWHMNCVPEETSLVPAEADRFIPGRTANLAHVPFEGPYLGNDDAWANVGSWM